MMAVLAGLPSVALAQTGDEAAPAEAEAEPAATPSTPEAPERHAYSPRAPLPVMVAALPARGVPEDYAGAAQVALVEKLTAVSEERPVLGLGLQSLRNALAECEDDACLGAQITEARAQGAVLMRLRRRGGGYEATLEVRDPASGTVRGEPTVGRLPRRLDDVPAAIEELVAQLQPNLPDPPPAPASLTVTVSEDNATVAVDGEEIGLSPVLPVQVFIGEHAISVRLAGFRPENRRTRVGPGEQARVDVTLRDLTPEEAVALGDPSAPSGSLTDEDWFWPVVIGGGVLVVGAIVVIVAVVASGGQTEVPDPSGVPFPRIIGGDM